VKTTCSCGRHMLVVSVAPLVSPGVVIPSPARVVVCVWCDGATAETAIKNERSVIRA
jgi:hypothetical protein